MSVVAKTVVFWLLMGCSLIGLWYALGHRGGFSLSEFLFSAVFVLLTFWVEGRVAASRRPWFNVLVGSGITAIAAGMYGLFKFQMLRYGFGGRRGLVESEVSVAVFVICTAVTIWAFVRFRRTAVG